MPLEYMRVPKIHPWRQPRSSSMSTIVSDVITIPTGGTIDKFYSGMGTSILASLPRTIKRLCFTDIRFDIRVYRQDTA